MDSQAERVTVWDVERRFLADKRWWATRIGISIMGAAVVFLSALTEGFQAAVAASVVTGVLVLVLLFREDHLFLGVTYKIGGVLPGSVGKYRVWVEQHGEFPAHEGSVIVLVRTAGIFRPRRSIMVFDDLGDNPFGRPMTPIKGGGFWIDRHESHRGRIRENHIDGVVIVLLQDQRVA